MSMRSCASQQELRDKLKIQLYQTDRLALKRLEDVYTKEVQGHEFVIDCPCWQQCIGEIVYAPVYRRISIMSVLELLYIRIRICHHIRERFETIHADMMARNINEPSNRSTDSPSFRINKCTHSCCGSWLYGSKQYRLLNSANRPDLNPFEHSWAMKGRRLRNLGRSTAKLQELARAVNEIWHKMPSTLDTFHTLAR